MFFQDMQGYILWLLKAIRSEEKKNFLIQYDCSNICSHFLFRSSGKKRSRCARLVFRSLEDRFAKPVKLISNKKKKTFLGLQDL